MKVTKSRSPRSFTQAALAACAFTALMISVVPVNAQSQDASRLARIEAQMDTLSRAVFKGQMPPTGSVTPLSGGASADYQADVEARLSDMEKQVRDLTGKVEELSFQNAQLKTQLEKALADIELRFQGNAVPGAAPISGAGVTQSGTLAPQDMGGPVTQMDDDPPPGMPVAGAAPAPAATTTPPRDVNAPADPNSPSVNNLGTLNQAPGGAAIPPQGNSDATTQYETAFSQLKSGNYVAARTGFEAFLKANPDHPLAANATYWLGECYYGQGQYEKATRIFAESYKKYPQGPKVADSLLKMGMSLGASGKKKEGCVTLQQLRKEFPSGQGVTLRRADQEMTKLGCNG